MEAEQASSGLEVVKVSKTQPPDRDKAHLAERVMLSIISSVPGFRPPAQARSREVTFAIVSVTSALLKTKSYDSIRMQDIAERAGCAVTAIYARFGDKSALLAAVNLLVIEEYRSFMDREFSAEAFRATGLRGLVTALVEMNQRYHTENHNFVVASMTDANRVGYSLIAPILSAYATRISGIAAELLGEPAEALFPSIRLAIRTLLSLYRDGTLGIGYLPHYRVETLVDLFCTIVERSLTE